MLLLDEQGFRDLIRRVRAGDARAAEQLVREYQDEIRRIVRIRLTDPRLRTDFESMDICQSVLGNFFARVAVGQFDLEKPEDLLKLLATMAVNKVKDHWRKAQAQKRGRRTVQQPDDSQNPVAQAADPGPRPDSIVAQQEMLHKIRGLMSEEERYLSEQRAQGREWDDIAAGLPHSPEPVGTRLAGSTPESLRKKLERAMNRVATQIGLDDSNLN